GGDGTADPLWKPSERDQGWFSRCRCRGSLRVGGPRSTVLSLWPPEWPPMRCVSCGFENPVDASFCGECAAPLASTLSCPSCGKANPAKQKFCNGCGRSLGGSTDRSAYPDPRTYTPKHLAEKILTSRSAREGERK